MVVESDQLPRFLGGVEADGHLHGSVSKGLRLLSGQEIDHVAALYSCVMTRVCLRGEERSKSQKDPRNGPNEEHGSVLTVQDS